MGRIALWVVSFAVCGTIVALPTAASAQAPGAYQHQPPPDSGYPPPPPMHRPARPFVERTGFTIGVTLGPGSLSAVDDRGDEVEAFDGVSASVSIGGMLNPRLALVGDLWNISHYNDADDFRLQQHIVTIALQYWLTPRLWAKAGIGRAQYQVGTRDFDQEKSEEVPAVMGGLGYELSHGSTFSVDAQLRLGVGSYDEGDLHSGALVLGLNWY